MKATMLRNSLSYILCAYRKIDTSLKLHESMQLLVRAITFNSLYIRGPSHVHTAGKPLMWTVVRGFMTAFWRARTIHIQRSAVIQEAVGLASVRVLRESTHARISVHRELHWPTRKQRRAHHWKWHTLDRHARLHRHWLGGERTTRHRRCWDKRRSDDRNRTYTTAHDRAARRHRTCNEFGATMCMSE